MLVSVVFTMMLGTARQFPVEVDEFATVGDLKKKVAEARPGMRADRQILRLHNLPLQDECTIKDSGITTRSLVFCEVRSLLPAPLPARPAAAPAAVASSLESQLQAALAEVARLQEALVLTQRDLERTQVASARAEERQQQAESRCERGLLDFGRSHAARLPRLVQASEYAIDALPMDSSIAMFLADLTQASLTKHRRDIRSPDFCDPPILEVVSVRAIMNPRLQAKYTTQLGDVQSKRGGGCSVLPVLSNWKLPPQSSEPDLNEHLLFHGAPPGTIDLICRGGFKPQRGGEVTGKMFGVASYFAASASKSDDYTEDRANPLPRQAVRTLIVARVALGEPHFTKMSMPNATRPPDGPDGLELDSVVAWPRSDGGAVDHLEAMIYNESMALPVFLVDYKHCNQCPCAFCRRRPA